MSRSVHTTTNTATTTIAGSKQSAHHQDCDRVASTSRARPEFDRHIRAHRPSSRDHMSADSCGPDWTSSRHALPVESNRGQTTRSGRRKECEVDMARGIFEEARKRHLHTEGKGPWDRWILPSLVSRSNLVKEERLYLARMSRILLLSWM